MKLEREPVFGQLTLSHKPDYKPFDHNKNTLDSAGLQSANWIVKDTQNKVLCDTKNEEDAGQDDAGLTASSFDISKSVDDMETCKGGEVDGFASEKLESLRQQTDYYMDKSVMEYDLPELIVCYKDNSCNTIKDICIDEGVPSQEKIWYESDVNEKAVCTYVSPDEDQKKHLPEEQMDIVTKVPDGTFKFTAQKHDVKKDFVIPCDPKDLVQRGQQIFDKSEKTANDVSRDIYSLAKKLSMNDSLTLNLRFPSSNKDSDDAVQDTVQIPSQQESVVAHTENVLVSSTEESSNIEDEASGKLDPVPSAVALNFLHDIGSNGEGESGSNTVGLDRSAPVSISRFAKVDPLLSTERSSCLVDELPGTSKADKGGSSTFCLDCPEPLAITGDICPRNEFSERLETKNMSEDDSDDICDPKVGPSKTRPLAPVTNSRDDCSENGACQWPETSNVSMIDEENHDSENVSSQDQHSLASATIAREECSVDGISSAQDVPVTVQRDLGESSFSAGLPFSTLINFTGTRNASSEVQHDQGESSFSAAGHLSSLINSSGPIPSDSGRFLVQRDMGDSSFAAAGQSSSLISSSGPIPYSGSISFRSDGSATSTRSFAFPVIHPHEPFCSPVRMAKADRRLLRKHRGWKLGILCCRF